LGKTIQSICFLQYLKNNENIRGPFLVVAPLSTLVNWASEFEKWTDINVVVYQGSHISRDIIKKNEFFFFDDHNQIMKSGPVKFNVLITSYEMTIAQDWIDLQQIDWRVLIVDEAHRLKNPESTLTRQLKQFKVEHRILLTGTPLQNNIQELWTLFNFINPQKFSSQSEFITEYGQLENAEQVSKLYSIIRPHMLRRLKADVGKSILPIDTDTL